MELIISNEMQQLPAITFNYEQIVSELKPKLENYKNMVYTDENIAVAKKDKALLNNLSKAINGKKIDIKNKCLEPYTVFENQIKTIIGMIGETTDVIDKQVKSYDEQVKSKKREGIEAYFNEASAPLNGVLKLDNIFSQRWLNVTVKLKEIKAEIDEIVKRTQADIELIDNLHSEFETELKTTYLSTLDVSCVLRKKTELETAKERLNAIKPKTAPTASFNSQSINTPPTLQSPSHQPVFAEKEHTESAELITIAFKVIDVTAEQLAMLSKFMQDNGIKYGKAE